MCSPATSCSRFDIACFTMSACRIPLVSPHHGATSPCVTNVAESLEDALPPRLLSFFFSAFTYAVRIMASSRVTLGGDAASLSSRKTGTDALIPSAYIFACCTLPVTLSSSGIACEAEFALTGTRRMSDDPTPADTRLHAPSCRASLNSYSSMYVTRADFPKVRRPLYMDEFCGRGRLLVRVDMKVCLCTCATWSSILGFSSSFTKHLSPWSFKPRLKVFSAVRTRVRRDWSRSWTRFACAVAKMSRFEVDLKALAGIFLSFGGT
mmetsp:Transcript_29934/g.95658  ORF Transcript_29934/g.95658 Transcript_29934/m.95658 type:complete len:265 (-) Transcript_29934:1084-1878(-)